MAYTQPPPKSSIAKTLRLDMPQATAYAPRGQVDGCPKSKSQFPKGIYPVMKPKRDHPFPPRRPWPPGHLPRSGPSGHPNQSN